jgi:hypothetical protein
MRLVKVATVGLLTIGLLGCGPGGPQTHTVKGRLELARGDVSQLDGSILEAALQSDTTVRASGVIRPDGSFSLETLHAGKVFQGAQAGTYQVRILPCDDDPASRKRALAVLPKQALQFETAHLTFQVPSEGEVVLKVNPK